MPADGSRSTPTRAWSPWPAGSTAKRPPRYDITVRATSTDTSSTTQTYTIAIGDVDEFDTGAVTDSDARANTVAEDAIVGTAVGLTGLATDADATDSVTYSLSDDAGGRFAIDANTGVVTVNGALDYEANTSHSVTILATSDDGSTSSQAFTINVTDVNEGAVGAVSDTDATADAVDEDAIVGTAVGVTANATDPDGSDTVSYTLDDDAGGLFAIDANTGIVTVAGGPGCRDGHQPQHHDPRHLERHQLQHHHAVDRGQ